MKNIELTEDHKSKLLEMCNKLFPEYTTIPANKNPKFLTISYFSDLGFFIHLMNDDLKENILIHWFEFCMTHLYIKLIKENFNSRLYLLSILDKESDKHIIDYLYEEFKKL